MKIRGMGLALPSHQVSNDDVLEMIASSNHGLSPKAEKQYLKMTRKLLRFSGTETRHWLADDERPVDLLRGAVDEALAEAGLEHRQVDLVIYAAVSRGFLEPAESFALSKSAGLDPADCFDVLEACNSFSRAVEIAQFYLDAGRADNALVVVGEFCVNGSSFVKATFAPRTLGELGWRLPSYTLGEAAAAILLEPSDDAWNFRCHTDASLADACVVAFPWGADYGPELIEGPHQAEQFRSFGQRMHAAALPATLQMWEEFEAEAPEKIDEAALMITHTPSRTLADRFCEEAGFPYEKLYSVYSRYGNVGSASIPMGLYMARQEGRLRREDQVLCLVGAAGMSFMLYDFVF